MWSRLSQSYNQGDCLATLGTGMQPLDLPDHGCHLLASHSYPIMGSSVLICFLFNQFTLTPHVDISSDRVVSILDSWDGLRSSDASSPEDLAGVVENLELKASSTNRILRFTWEEICGIFDTLYLSWNPSLWKHQINLHRYVLMYTCNRGLRYHP